MRTDWVKKTNKSRRGLKENCTKSVLCFWKIVKQKYINAVRMIKSTRPSQRVHVINTFALYFWLHFKLQPYFLKDSFRFFFSNQSIVIRFDLKKKINVSMHLTGMIGTKTYLLILHLRVLQRILCIWKIVKIEFEFEFWNEKYKKNSMKSSSWRVSITFLTFVESIRLLNQSKKLCYCWLLACSSDCSKAMFQDTRYT